MSAVLGGHTIGQTALSLLAKLGQKMRHGRDDTDQLDEGRIGEQNEQM